MAKDYVSGIEYEEETGFLVKSMIEQVTTQHSVSRFEQVSRRS